MARILFKMSGSIACYKSCSVISSLVKKGHEVQVVITKDVLNFVGLSTLEGLSGREVLSEVHHSGQMMSHIHLNTWADLSLLCPASANTLAKMALGISDNLISTLALARENQKPYLIFPAMNPKMWAAVPQQKNIQSLKKQGYQIHLGDEGSMACGDYGMGRLMEPEDILKTIDQKLSQSLTRPKLLITAGGTAEKIDAVRTLSNLSTGQTGLRLAKHLARSFDVSLLLSENSKGQLLAPEMQSSLSQIKINFFSNYQDLKSQMQDLLSEADFTGVVHAAAVSDFSPHKIIQDGQAYDLPLQKKLPTSETLEIQLIKNPKLIAGIKDWSKNKDIVVIGFKLLEDRDLNLRNESLTKVLKNADYVFLNYLEDVQESQHIFTVFNKSKKEIQKGTSKIQMALAIEDILLSGISKNNHRELEL